MDNWREQSSWRTRDPAAAGAATAPTSDKPARPQQPPRPLSGRLTAPSWRTSGASPSNDDDAPPREQQQRRRDFPSGTGTRPSDRRARTSARPQSEEESAAAVAIAEGRRIYIGNLRYQAKPDDIATVLKASGFDAFVRIHMSVDPFTGRNPSYCFVEFADKEVAASAMETLEGKLLLGRELKCRPCVPKGAQSGGGAGGGGSAGGAGRQGGSEGLSRWGDWSERKNGGGADGGRGRDRVRGGRLEGEDDVVSSAFRYQKDFTGKRLYVGGLPRMLDQATNFAEMTELFKDYKV